MITILLNDHLNDDDNGNMMMMMRNDDHERVRKMSPGGVGRGSGAGLPGAADLGRNWTAQLVIVEYPAFAKRVNIHDKQGRLEKVCGEVAKPALGCAQV